MPRSLLPALALVIFMPLTALAQNSVQQVGWTTSKVQQGGTNSSALQGAWTLTEVSVSTPDTSWTEANLQPSLYVFLQRARRFLRIGGLSFSDDPTDAERLGAFGPFVVNAGVYEEVSGTALTIQPLVALYPNAISDTSEYTYTHRIEGDILRLTLTAPWAEGGEVRYTLARLR